MFLSETRSWRRRRTPAGARSARTNLSERTLVYKRWVDFTWLLMASDCLLKMEFSLQNKVRATWVHLTENEHWRTILPDLFIGRSPVTLFKCSAEHSIPKKFASVFSPELRKSPRVLLRDRVTSDIPTLTLPLRRDVDRKLHRSFDGGFDTGKRLFDFRFNIIDFARRLSFLSAAFSSFNVRVKRSAASFSPSSLQMSAPYRTQPSQSVQRVGLPR
jgi:hypothetical protein